MPRKRKDLTGQRFGMLVAIEPRYSDKGYATWLCRCDCGNLKEIPTGNLTTQGTTSCGCLRGNVRSSRDYNVLEDEDDLFCSPEDLDRLCERMGTWRSRGAIATLANVTLDEVREAFERIKARRQKECAELEV